jgi:hypothetical protein
VSIFSIDSLIINQIDNASLSYPAFIDSLGQELRIYTPNDDNNRTLTDERIEVDNLFGDAESISKYQEENNGAYQIAVFVKEDTGTGKLQRLLQELKNQYSRVITDTDIDNPDLNIRSISPSSPRVDGKFYRAELTINYFSFDNWS